MNGTSQHTEGPHIISEDVTIGLVNERIDTHCCIRFKKMQELCNSGVRRIMASFTVIPSARHGPGKEAVSFGTDRTIVVPFNATGQMKEDALAQENWREVWYGIVDGAHVHEAVVRLKRTEDKERLLVACHCCEGRDPSERFVQRPRMKEDDTHHTCLCN